MVETMFDSPLADIAVVLAAAAVVGGLTLALRQPLIVGYIAAGIVAGPNLFDVVGGEEFELLADLGIAILLFLVGLKLDPQLLRSTGRVALIAGMGQIVFTALAGFGLAMLLGIGLVGSIYTGLTLTFSSTIIIVKLLSDKRQLDDLHGRITVGFLIVQDVIAVLALIVITALGATGGEAVGSRLSGILVRGGLFLGVLAVLIRWVLPWVVGKAASSRELLVIGAVAWAVLVSASSDQLGFSTELGAFLAGFALASTPYREAIASRLTGLRDFMLLFFFVDLGAGIDLGGVGSNLGAALAISSFVLLGKPLIVMAILGMMGYRRRTGLLTGVSLAQISEFSLIVAALGLRVGHIDEAVFGLITVVAIVTISASTYGILNAEWLLERLGPRLSAFERAHPVHHDTGRHHEGDADAVVYGLGRHGTIIARGLRDAGWRVIGVDMDPEALRRCDDDIEVIYGDADDPEFTSNLPLDQVTWVVSTVPDLNADLALLHGLRAEGYEGQVAMAAHTPEAARRLEDEGVDMVFSPFMAASRQALDTLFQSRADRISD